MKDLAPYFPVILEQNLPIRQFQSEFGSKLLLF
jgi:hypothetical protein